MRLSRNIIYRFIAGAAIPIAIYNFIVWFSNPENMWEQQYLRSFIGGITCSVLSITLIVISFTQQDKIISICGSENAVS